MGWFCRFCITENSSSNPRCGVCQHPRKKHTAYEEWKCLICKAQNPEGNLHAKCVECNETRGTTPAQLALDRKKREEEEHQEAARAQELARRAVKQEAFMENLRKELMQDSGEARRARMALHKVQYQASDLRAAKVAYKQARLNAEAESARRRYEEDLERQEAENRAREMNWLSELTVVPPAVMMQLEGRETSVAEIKEMSNSELIAMGFSENGAEQILKAVVKEAREAAIAAGEYFEEEEEEKKVPAGPSPEELELLAAQAEEQKQKEAAEAEEASKKAEEAAKRAEVEQAVKLREEKQKLRELKQAEKREATKKRQAKLALEKKKKEELRLTKLKEKAEAAKLEARRKEEEAYEAERVANRAKMEAFLAAERARLEGDTKEQAAEVDEPVQEEKEEEEVLPPPVFFSSGRLLAQLSENAFQDTGGELRLGLLGLSTSCATVYGKRANIARRELTWILKAIIKVYGENIIVTTPLADEMEILGAELVLNMGLQLRALLPPAGPSQDTHDSSDTKLRTFDVGAAVSAAIGPDENHVHPEYHATLAQRRSRLSELLSKDNVSVYHVPSLEWETHGYHCVRGILTESSDMLLAVVDAIPSPSPPGLLWDSVRSGLVRRTPMVVIKSHENGADVHRFKFTDALGRALLTRYSAIPCL